MPLPRSPVGRRRGGQRAFTLVELLVVLAVIALLAALVFPVLAGAREKSRQSVCMSNLRQIGMASLQYAQDFDGKLMAPALGLHPIYFWGDMVDPYLAGGRAVLSCPSASRAFEATPPGPGFAHGIGWEWSYNYALNAVEDAQGEPAGASGATLAALSRPAGTLLFVDGWPAALPFPQGDPGRHAIRWRVGGRDAAHQEQHDGCPRHNGGFNALWCDAHATWRTRSKRSANDTFTGGTKENEWLSNQP